MDREGSKSQLRHTEPPRKNKRKKSERRGNISQRNLCNSCSTIHSSKNNNNLACDFLWEANRTRSLSQLSKNTETGYVLWSINTINSLFVPNYRHFQCHFTTSVFTRTIPFKHYFDTKYLCTSSSFVINFCYKIGLSHLVTLNYFTFSKTVIELTS